MREPSPHGGTEPLVALYLALIHDRTAPRGTTANFRSLPKERPRTSRTDPRTPDFGGPTTATRRSVDKAKQQYTHERESGERPTPQEQ